MNMNKLPAFWIEILDVSGVVVSRQRVQSGVATIGRAEHAPVIADEQPVPRPGQCVVVGMPGDDAIPDW